MALVLGLFINLIFVSLIQNLFPQLIEILRNWDLLLILIFIILGGFAGYYYGTIQVGGFVPSNEFVKEEPKATEKILDSSVIIDGRILKIAKTNFIEGSFIIPNFVLREIQLISDSADPIKRNRGRRGLDMLNELQQLNNIKVKISYIDYPDIRDVDSKLVQLARDIGGKLITNDFNLEKVAEVQGVQVLNLNALTEALRPIVLPGEELKIQVVKEGKDENQGIGYLDDGTMVVIEDGRELIGKLVKVTVTSIIQTAAGKMIFTKAIGPVSEEEQQQNTQEKDSNKNKKARENLLKRAKR
ncbi:MAG: hypothetical protein KatS3mg129_1158 [Leptospiraceae bacterium]|nr:MAG: hypothetical protein KatS3mg129_1158 [Leptospiraceae bacterium]